MNSRSAVIQWRNRNLQLRWASRCRTSKAEQIGDNESRRNSLLSALIMIRVVNLLALTTMPPELPALIEIADKPPELNTGAQ